MQALLVNFSIKDLDFLKYYNLILNHIFYNITNVNYKAKIEKNEILPNNRIEEPSLIQRLLSYVSCCKE